jgi:hypothetical protein
MTKHRPSPSKAVGREQQFEKLLAAMGVNNATDPFARVAIEGKLEQIESEYARRVAQLSKQPNRKLVRRYRAAVTKLLSLSKTVGPDFLTEIEEAGWSRHNPNADDGTLYMVMTEGLAELGHKQIDLTAELTAHGLDIDHWLRSSGDTYRKRVVRQLAVEPFLRLLAESKITTSRKLPRTRMVGALLDYLGVEQKFRLTDAAINAIARDPTGTRSSEAIAKQQTKN